jgi:hypothetical protein
MEYLIPIVLLLLLVTGFVTFLVLNATRKSKPSEAEGDGRSSPAHLAASDRSPLGDTTEHAGEQSERGHTAGDPEGAGEGDADGHAGAAHPGEGEGSTTVPRPESERLGNRS